MNTHWQSKLVRAIHNGLNAYKQLANPPPPQLQITAMTTETNKLDELIFDIVSWIYKILLVNIFIHSTADP